MKTKINLSNLKESDYKALLKNDKVVSKLIEYNSESETLLINNWLDPLNGLSDYSLGGSDNHNYMVVQDSYKFLKSVLIAQRDYNLLSNDLIKKAEKYLSEYEDAEPLDLLYYDDKLDEIGKQVADKLVEIAKTEYDYSMSGTFLMNAMKNYEALINIYGEDAYYNRDENKIYYICED